ncbi:hypothetical protein Tco_0386487 [Tanacetum coccineum]
MWLTFMWMDASPGPSTTQSYSRNSSRPSSFSRKLLHDQDEKTLEARISVLEGKREMEGNPENHTLESAGILHEIYQGMRNLNME